MDHIVHSFIKKHQLIHPNQTVLAAVSGGPDSMALLHFLTRMKAGRQLRVIAVAVDHELRGEDSAGDLSYVEAMCKQWNIEFEGTSVDVHSYKQSMGLGTQEAARHLRYHFFEKMMKKYEADVLAMGHHGDDQAETMMMQIVRSARPEAVQGIPVQRPFADGSIVRPFLCISKSDIVQYNTNHRIKPRLDASNEETDYTRNAFRKHVMPYLQKQNPKLHQHMQAMSERVREDQSYISKEAEEVLKTVKFSSNLEKNAEFSLETFKTFPFALQRSAFHLILNYLYVNQTEDISFLHEEMFFRFLKEDKPNAELHFPKGLMIMRAYDEITCTFQYEKSDSSFNKLLAVGDTVELPDGTHLSAEWSDSKAEEGLYDFVCDSHHVELPLVVRTRKNGDRMRLRGMNGSKKVKDIFIDQKIPARLRQTWPLVTDSRGEILWLIGLKKGGECTGRLSGPWLRLHCENKADM